MFAVLQAAIRFLIKFAFSGTVMKWGFLAFLTYGLTSLIGMIINQLPDWFTADNLSQGTSFFTPGMWYFIDYVHLDVGISLTLSALVVRFLIRRIPFVG